MQRREYNETLESDYVRGNLPIRAYVSFVTREKHVSEKVESLRYGHVGRISGGTKYWTR